MDPLPGVPIPAPTRSLPLTESRGVRFDDQCILIPDPQPPRSRMPRLLVKPFTFKRRHSQDSYSPTSPYQCEAPSPTGTFPRPALLRKFSPNEGPPLLCSPPIHCHSHSSLPPSPTTNFRPRAPSLPPLQHSERVTIPLRPCCTNCFSATERAAIQGENWTEKFSRAARRRRSASADNHPCPPHVLSEKQATIQWPTDLRECSAPPTFHSVVVVDEADHKASFVSKLTPAPDEDGQELADALTALDQLSVQDALLPPLLSRKNVLLSPIHSNNASVDDVSRAVCTVATDEADALPSYLSANSAQASPPSSPLLNTPPSAYSSPVASPKISSPSPASERESPRISSPFRIPKGSTLLRAGADILKGVSVIGTSPV